jgi:ADP-heptose:LPS heptosyltransferase
VIVNLTRRRYPLVVYLRGSAPFLLLGAGSRLAATKYVMNEHVVERYLKAIRPFVRDGRVRPPVLHLSPDAKRSAAALLGSGTNVLRIAMQATAAVPTKEWPLDRYVALADELRRRYRAEIHFLASPAERDRLEAALAGSTSKHAVHTSLSLGKVAAVIAACDLFVGNDSGLSHVAAAVNTPMVLVWGPANIHEAKPLADPARCAIEYRAVPCRSRCREIECVNDAAPMQCLRDVQLEDVLASAGRMLEAVSEQSWRRVAPV